VEAILLMLVMETMLALMVAVVVLAIKIITL
jgi:hypothetical protein